MNRFSALLIPLVLFFGGLPPAFAEQLQIGNTAPTFQAKTHDGGEFDLNSRRGNGWTVLYFYPKAGTPGCTAQACAFRDAIQAIRQQGAEVYGLSTDSVAELAKFHREHKLGFTLLSDPDASVTEAYGAKMPVLTMAKRWTFIIDPELKVRRIDNDVDPALDAQKVAAALKQLQGKP
ncbi:peroxiredoxin [Methylomonas sp. EFPC3]|uniref:peroxiredoxin n=1 Tax=Methylomonas sp. EFPC3 TaxID=3021710 RepID=UPI0024167ACA|nr:peroxiredoxin [Methylomonas sp. EFPC3]WFP50581.1 peroxiredoxin [Methylomonas sp. EFPC3]